MSNTSDWVVLGRLGRPQGLKGLIRVISFTQPTFAILDYEAWFIQKKDHWLPLKLETFQTQNDVILAKISGYTEREAVGELTNCNIGVSADQLPQLPEGEYYWHELKKMSVINQEGICLGKVIDILPTGANDVLVVSGDKRHLIPYVPKVHIISVDPLQQQIMVDWDENF